MGATTLQTVTTEAGEIVFNTDMPMRALVGLMAAANDGDLPVLIDSLASFTVEWPYEGDPSDSEAWLDLPRTSFNEAVEAIMAGLGDSGNA